MSKAAEHPPLAISSRSNAWYRRLREALEHHDAEIIIEGPKQIRDSIAAGWTPLAMVYAKGASLRIPSEAPELVLTANLFRDISGTVHPQGVLGLFERRDSSPGEALEDEEGIVVILDGVQDPGNVGTIIRLAAAFDCSGVLLTEDCADPFSPKSMRASAGTVLRIPVCRTSRSEILGALREKGWELWAASADAPSGVLRGRKIAIAFGSEGSGVSPALKGNARTISIDSSDRVESLNVAAAAAILLHGSYVARR